MRNSLCRGDNAIVVSRANKIPSDRCAIFFGYVRHIAENLRHRSGAGLPRLQFDNNCGAIRPFRENVDEAGPYFSLLSAISQDKSLLELM